MNNFKKFLIVSFAVFPFSLLGELELHVSNPKKDWCKFYERINSILPSDTFIESGTYLGQTAAKAAHCFEEVHTVELEDAFYQQSVENLRSYANVRVYHGDTVEIFKRLMPQLASQKRRMIFWLDGHFMSCMSDAENVEDISIEGEYTPIMQELRLIKENNLDEAILLIDDVRLFGTQLEDKRIKCAGNDHYPLLADVCRFLSESGYGYQMMGDIMVAHKTSSSIQFSAVVHACTLSRLFDGANYEIKDVLAAEQLIASCSGEQAESIEELYKDFAMPWRGWRNKSPHYNLWYGLISHHRGNQLQASSQFKEVISLGYNHWRIYWYLSEALFCIKDYEGAMNALKTVLSTEPEFQPAQLLLEKVKNNLIKNNT